MQWASILAFNRYMYLVYHAHTSKIKRNRIAYNRKLKKTSFFASNVNLCIDDSLHCSRITVNWRMRTLLCSSNNGELWIVWVSSSQFSLQVSCKRRPWCLSFFTFSCVYLYHVLSLSLKLYGIRCWYWCLIMILYNKIKENIHIIKHSFLFFFIHT